MSMPVTSEISAAKPRRFKIASPQSSDRAGNTGQSMQRLSGLGPMCQVKTSFGDFPAQALREGDRVMVRGGGYLPIKSVQRSVFDEDFLRYHPGAQPVVIRAGAFGINLPEKDVILAPFQKFDQKQRFVCAGKDKAVDALERAQVFRVPENIITYTVINLGRPASICCSGVWIEV